MHYEEKKTFLVTPGKRFGVKALITRKGQEISGSTVREGTRLPLDGVPVIISEGHYLGTLVR